MWGALTLLWEGSLPLAPRRPVGLRPPALDSELLSTSYLRVTFIVGFNFALATGG